MNTKYVIIGLIAAISILSTSVAVTATPPFQYYDNPEDQLAGTLNKIGGSIATWKFTPENDIVTSIDLFVVNYVDYNTGNLVSQKLDIKKFYIQNDGDVIIHLDVNQAKALANLLTESQRNGAIPVIEGQAENIGGFWASTTGFAWRRGG